MFLVNHSLYNPMFCSYSTQTDSYRFFVKLNLLVIFTLMLHECVFITEIVISSTGDSFLEYARPKQKKFRFQLGFNAIKRL